MYTTGSSLMLTHSAWQRLPADGDALPATDCATQHEANRCGGLLPWCAVSPTNDAVEPFLGCVAHGRMQMCRLLCKFLPRRAVLCLQHTDENGTTGVFSTTAMELLDSNLGC